MSEEEENEIAKIIRIPGDNLSVPLSSSELDYRNKFLPNPKKLDDIKLVCTVCSVSLAAQVHEGADLFVHRALSVLICQNCYKFYGNGNFSVDEDNDDKYCRWCGQGGTLYVCFSCTCAFCKKCVRQNMKPSALADLEDEKWRCYICVPRPLYGCRAICWAAQELNLIGKEKKRLKLKSQAEKLKNISERKKYKSLNKSSTAFDKDKHTPKKRRRREESELEDGNSSTDTIPPKKIKTCGDSSKMNGRSNKTPHGNPKKSSKIQKKFNRTPHSPSSSSESESEKVNGKLEKFQNGKGSESSASSDSGQKARLVRKRRKFKRDKRYTSLSESSEPTVKKYRKKKMKHKVKEHSSSSESSDSESIKHRRKRKNRKNRSLSDCENQESALESKSVVESHQNYSNNSKVNHHNIKVKNIFAEDNGRNIDQDNVKLSQVEGNVDSKKESDARSKAEEVFILSKVGNSSNGSSINEDGVHTKNQTEEVLNNVVEHTDDSLIDKDDTQNNMLKGSDCPLLELTKESLPDKYDTQKNTPCKSDGPNVHVSPTEEAKSDNMVSDVPDMDEVVKDNIKCAVGLLENTLNDIGELGGVISIQATKFSERKIHPGNMSSLEEVVETLSKLKQFIKGIHDNYEEIEANMDSLVKPWKIKTGLEAVETEELTETGNVNVTTSSESCVSNDCVERKEVYNNEVPESSVSNDCVERNEVNSNEVPNNVSEGHESHSLEPVDQATIKQTEELIPEDGLSQSETNSISVCVNSETLPGLADSVNNDDTEENVDLPEVSTMKNADSSKSSQYMQPDSGDGKVEEHNCDTGTHLRLTEKITVEENQVDTKVEPEDLNENNKANNLQEVMDNFQELTVTPHINKENPDTQLATVDNGDPLLAPSSKIIVKTEDLENFEIEISKSDRLIERLEKNLNEILNPIEKEETFETPNEVPLESIETNKVVQEGDNFEALQAMLYSSSDDGFSSSDSDDSSEIQLDDSDLDDKITKKKVLSSKPKKKDDVQDHAKNEGALEKEEIPLKNKSPNRETEKLENNDKEENEEAVENPAGNMETNYEGGNEPAPSSSNQSPKKAEELDSEEEINMLTDINQLKKKFYARKLKVYTSSEGSSGEESGSDSDEELKVDKRKGMKYKNESKKRREEERNELFGFLDKASNSEGELDISKNDLDHIEDQYASSSSDSMSLQVFGQKLSEKWKEMEKEQEEMNLQMLLAPESDEDNQGRDNISSDSDSDGNRKKKVPKEKVKKDKLDTENKEESEGQPEEEGKQSDKEIEIKEENISDKDIKIEADDKYEQFLDGILSKKIKFEGLGSTTEESQSEKEELLKIKSEKNTSEEDTGKEPLNSKKLDLDFDSSESSVILEDMLTKDKEKEKYMIKKLKRHKLFNIKLSDTDTSDEERWWKRRIQKEQKKKEAGDDSDSSDLEALETRFSRKSIQCTPQKSKARKKSLNDKEKQMKTRSDDSSTLELSSSESSGSEVFKKKRKKKAKSSGSDGSSGDDRKKKKKRRNLSGDSSNDSSNSDSDVIAISQKSNQGESPKGSGRKNIRKLMTKHELAAATKAAAKEEEERRKRIAARQKLFNEIFEVKEAEVLEKLVLDFDPETKTELIAVDKDLVTKMKPHQAKGVKFMWDSCFESLSQIKNNKGSGCILAHCMGLGKTFQVISLVHTILKHKDTSVRTVLVVCPLSTVLNWYSEFDKWLEDVHKGRDIKVYHLTKHKKVHERSRQLLEWKRTGGVMIIGYELFRILTNPDTKKFRLTLKQSFQETLIDPGADLVVCDEGHMLKNESTILSKAMSRIKTLRRIVLTGTPMQNNLKEYHCMVQFVKPNLLGTRKEFLNQFANPITNGQFVDSTEADVKVMKRRSHVLHKMLEGLVQRCDYSVLTPFLPPKHEYVISVRLTELQVQLYQVYLDHFSQKSTTRPGSQLFSDWQGLSRIWTHPYVLKLTFEKNEHERQKKAEEESEDDKNSNDEKLSSIKLSSSHSSSSSDDENCDKKMKKETNTKSLETKTSPSSIIEEEINLISSDEEQVVPESNQNVPEEINIAAESTENADAITNNAEGTTENAEGSTEKAEGTTEKAEGTTEKAEGTTGNAEETTENATEETKDHSKNECEGDVDKETGERKEEHENNNDNATTTELDNDPKDENNKKIEVSKDSKSDWWKDIIEPEHFEDINQSGKLILLFSILKECELIEDKVLVFSQSLFSLDLIEYFLALLDKTDEESLLDESFGVPTGSWKKGLDYFRLDGSTAPDQRSAWCKAFNRDDNPRPRLFLISTRAGGLGINLTGANRVIIFDASWNPSHDIQSIFRIYRFGQKKPCYVYRFIASGTMEEKVYDRQVAKQSLSSRVVDEQQVERHFSTNDLNELYRFTPPGPIEDRPTPALPKDRLMAELLAQHNLLIEKYHEHDSLLENIEEEELNEEERKLAWEDYENEKKRGLMPITGAGPGFPFGGAANNFNQLDFFRNSLMNKYPNASEAEMNGMLATLMNQVRNRTAQNAQQFITQPQAQPSTSNNQIRFQQSNQNLAREQKFNIQRNKVLQRYGQPVPNNAQRMGNKMIKQNHRTESKQKPTQEDYMTEMRKQQDANLERIKNQQFQSSTTIQSTSNQTNYNRFQPTPSNSLQQTHNGNVAQAVSQVVNQQPTVNRQLFKNNQSLRNQRFVQNRTQVQNQGHIQNRNVLNNQQYHGRIQKRNMLNNQQNQAPIQNRQNVLNNPQSQAPIENRNQVNNQRNRQPVNQTQQNRLSLKNLLPPNGKVIANNFQGRNRLINTTSRENGTVAMSSTNSNMIPRITRVESLQNKSGNPQQKLTQVEMAQRISAMQQQKQKNLQQKLKQSAQNPKSIAATAAKQRKLEEMKNRYKASRQPSTSQSVISDVVEIDDDA